MKKIIVLILTITLLSCQKDGLGLENDNTNELKNANLSKHDLSGEELFKSIFFGIGEFASQIEYMENIHSQIDLLDDKQRKELDSRVQNLFIAINTSYPGFFSEFKLGIVSSNQIGIEQVLEKASLVLYENLEALIPNSHLLKAEINKDIINGNILDDNNNIDTELIEENKNKYELILRDSYETGSGKNEIFLCSFAIVCVAYFAVLIHNTAAATVLVAVAAAVVVWAAFWTGDTGEPCPACPVVHPNGNENTSLIKEMLINSISETR